MITLKKVINPCHVPIHRTDRQVFCKIKIENGNLSISGVVGPAANGDCAGSCGQIQDVLLEENLTINNGWTPAMVGKLFAVWQKWHLNDMRSACEHQRAMGWTYEEHHDAKTFKGEDCPTCGYSIGSKWLREELPQDVVDFLSELPDSTRIPAWV